MPPEFKKHEPEKPAAAAQAPAAPEFVQALNIARVGDAQIRERLEEKRQGLLSVVDSIVLSYKAALSQLAEVERLLGTAPEARAPKTIQAALRKREAQKWRAETCQRILRTHGPLRTSAIHTLIVVACQPPSNRKAGTYAATLACLRGNKELFTFDQKDKTWKLAK